MFILLHLVVTIRKGRTIPVQALRVPGGWGSQISRQSAYEDGDTVIPTPRPALPYRKYSWYSFLLKVESTSGPQCGQKDYVYEKFQLHHRKSIPRPFRFVAQCLNQLRHRVSRTLYVPPGFNPLNAELNPICHLLELLGTHHILHVSRIRVKVKFSLSAPWSLSNDSEGTAALVLKFAARGKFNIKKILRYIHI